MAPTVVRQIRISYRQLEEMMAERGVTVDHTTI
jgi:transposase-like protein